MKREYLQRLDRYAIVPLHQPEGYSRIYTTPSTAMDTNLGIGIYADSNLTGIYPVESNRTEALVVCGYEPCKYEIDEQIYNVWEIRQYQTMAFPIWDKRNKLFYQTLGFFDYKSSLRDYVFQLAYFRANQIGDVDFIAETIDYFGKDGDVHVRAVEAEGCDRPSTRAYIEANIEITNKRIQNFTNLGMNYPLKKYGRARGEEYTHSMAVWVGDIIPNDAVQNTMALSIGYPGGDYFRY